MKLKSARALLRLTRPYNVVTSMVIALLGAWLAGPLRTPRPFLAALVVGLLLAAGNVLNDWTDIEVDRINKPYRPLPLGAIRPETALAAAIALYGLGLAVSLSLGAAAFGIAAALASLSVLYSLRLKRLAVVGNVVVSLLFGATILYGGFANGAGWPAGNAAWLIFFLMFAREILKTVEDYAGDKHWGVPTVAVVFGKARALVLFYALAAVFILATVLYGLAAGSPGYWILMIAGVHLPLAYALGRLLLQDSPERVAFAVRLTRWIYAAGLAAILLPTLGV